MAASYSTKTLRSKLFYYSVAACFIATHLLTSISSSPLISVVVAEQNSDESGPVVSVRKHISFSDFNLSKNPRIEEDVKLLGSARLSREKGSIVIPGDSGNNVMTEQAGRAIFSFPIRVFDPRTNATASFDTYFAFQLHNQTYVKNRSDYKEGNHGGSGLTFLIAPDEFTVGRSGPWLAMLNDACENLTSKFIAIEFDTRMNPEFGDPNDNHIGINLGTVISQVTINASDFNLSFHDGSIHHVFISYNSPSKTMRIKVGSDQYSTTTVYSGSLNLSPFLREYMFVGFSASTGKVLAQTHHILSWNFTSTSTALLRVPSSESCEDKLLLRRRKDSVSGEEDDDKEGPSTMFFIFVAVGVLCFAVLINLYFYSKRKRSSRISIPTAVNVPVVRPPIPNERGNKILRPRRFSYDAISTATKGFSESEILTNDDEYESGRIYRGVVSNGGFQVAVKRFSGNYLAATNVTNKRVFLKRAKCVSRVKHGNLVEILGWCYDKKEYMLVYEYVFNGCLDKWLFGVGVLPWNRRLEVLRNVADGLSHLHSCQLAHGNIRVNSVFLDVSFNALLGDFGLGADLGGGKDLAVSNRIAGDVFDFGVFVLEVVAGRRRRPKSVDTIVMDSSSSSAGVSSSWSSVSVVGDAMDLLDLVWIMHETEEKMMVLDNRISSGVDQVQAVRVVEIGLLCTLGENQGRPKIDEVIKYLNVDDPIPDLPATRPIVLCPYNSAPNLCGSYVCAPF